MAQPARYWIPSIAPSGLAFYSGQPLSAWRGSAFIGSLAFDLLLRLEIADGRVVHEERLLEGRFSRVRDVRQGPDGLLYVLAGGTNGQLIRIEPAQRKPVDAQPE
jgi:glucose/arabinose dehydrogenase